MCNHLLPVFFLLLTSSLTAQNEPYQEILKDPDVTWAAELNITFQINPTRSLFGNKAIGNTKTLLKFGQEKPLNTSIPYSYENENDLTDYLMDMLWNSSESAYDLDGKGDALDLEARKKFLCCDSIQDLPNYKLKQHGKIRSNTKDASLISGVKLRQLLYFNRKTANFGLYTYAYAPILGWSDQTDGTFYPFPNLRLLWFKMPPYDEQDQKRIPNLQNKDITWACRFITLNNLAGLEDLRVIRNNQPPVLETIFNRFHGDPNYEVFDTEVWKPIPWENRATIPLVRYNQRIEHGVIMESDSWAEKPEIYGVVRQICLMEVWFWDYTNKQLIVRPYAFAPLMDHLADGKQYPYFWKLMGPR